MKVGKPKELKAFELAKGVSRKEVIRGDNLLVTWNWAEPNTNIYPHKHDCEQVVYLLRGALDVTIGDETSLVEAEAAILIPRGIEHSVRVVGNEPLLSIDIYAPPLQTVFHTGSTHTE
jgi:mannose-6-phosphate isomerase-like protein (cupin superfamily)